MRRAPAAMGPAFALLLATVPAFPGHAAAGGRRSLPHSASRSMGLDTASHPLGSTHISVSWIWSKSDTAYRLEVSPEEDFSTVTVSRKEHSSASRPRGGRESTRVGHLQDATYYYVRVRRLGTNKSSWSSAVRVATKAHLPDKITSVAEQPGPDPGTATIKWSSDGGYTDFFRITTALSAFGSRHTPARGRHSTTFRAPGTARSLTLTPQQTKAAGAALGTGRHLFFRVTAVRHGDAASERRTFPHLRHATVAGEGPTTSGAALRVAAYNLHVASHDVAGHPWSSRAQLVADNIASRKPAVVGLAEMMPAMWTTKDGGPGLSTALSRAGVGQYSLTRTTTYSDSSPGDVRILYDPDQVQMTSTCDPNKFSCAIRFDQFGSSGVAAYAKFKDLASGQQFYFVAVHLTPGNNARTDVQRGKEAQAVADGIAAVNPQHLPVMVAGDFNSAQGSVGRDRPHSALLRAGYYDTTAAATQVNLQYNSVNHYRAQTPSSWGFGAMYDSIMTRGMPGSTRFEEVLTGAPWPSDHNMVVADLRLP